MNLHLPFVILTYINCTGSLLQADPTKRLSANVLTEEVVKLCKTNHVTPGQPINLVS